jgi:probable F420-dependent oxidoreductase
MKLGFSLPQLGPQATPDNLITIATRAEQLGYDSVWVLERLLWPLHPSEPYPATPDGSLPEAYQNVLDPIETLTFLAAHTTRVGLGTSVLVLPYHTPVVLARRLATLDVLSNGRALVGVGVGWSTDEFGAAGIPFERRGARSDEILEAMLAIWTSDPVKFDGKLFRIPESRIGPKPVQRPHPPVYVAGFGSYAFERAARYGNGWNPSGVPSFEWLEQMIGQFRDIAARSGRADMEVVLRAFTILFDKANPAARAPLMGTIGEIADDVKRLRDIGVTHLIHSPPSVGFAQTASVDPAIALMEKLIEITV